MFDLNLACFAIGVKAKQGDTKSNSREAIVNRWVGLMLVDDAIMVMIEDTGYRIESFICDAQLGRLLRPILGFGE